MKAPDHKLTRSEEDVRVKHHRPWLIMGGLVMLLLGVLVWLFAFYDAPAPEDADMMPRWSERGGDANPLARFLATLPSSTSLNASDLPLEVRMLQAGSEEDADVFLNNKAAMFVALDELMRTDPATWQWPDAPKLAQFPYVETPVYQELLPEVTGAIRLKTLRLVSLGRTPEAVEQCLLLARFGHNAQEGEGGFVQLLQMMRAQQAGETLLEKVLTSGEPSPELLRHGITELTRIEGSSREGIQFAIKINYQWFKHYMADRELRGKLLGSRYHTFKPGWINRFLVKPHCTLITRLQFDRPLLEGLAKDWPHTAAALHANARPYGKVFHTEEETLRLLDSNFGGKVMVAAEAEDLNSLLEELMRSLMRNRQIRIVLALRLHELEKGRLPERLEELVPAYLSAVPIDEHSGQPMKWDRSNLAIYSVGADQVDDHGDFEHGSFSRSKDLGTTYWWGTFSMPMSKN